MLCSLGQKIRNYYRILKGKQQLSSNFAWKITNDNRIVNGKRQLTSVF